MILIKNIPLVPLQQALFKLLKEKQTVPVLSTISPKAKLPYITVGGITAKPVSVKDLTIWRMTVNIDVWAGHDEKRTVNETLNDICTILTAKAEEMEIINYQVLDGEIDLVEAFPDAEGGYHGTLTTLLNLQRIS